MEKETVRGIKLRARERKEGRRKIDGGASKKLWRIK
jgi:hypothetical protein